MFAYQDPYTFSGILPVKNNPIKLIPDQNYISQLVDFTSKTMLLPVIPIKTPMGF